MPAAQAPPRDLARASMLLIVEGVELADTICSNLAGEAKGAPDLERVKRASALAHKCAAGKDTALEGATAARAAINAWERGGEGQIACAAIEALDGLTAVADALKSVGGTVPPTLDDAIHRADALATFFKGGVCNAKDGGQ